MENKMLEGKVALVAGATRGAGRGIAIELGAAGATVYATGRTTRFSKSDYEREETIEETAELVCQAGGKGIAIQVDHTEAAQVEKLFERISNEHDKLDILVNDIWGGEGKTEWDVPIWEQSLEKGLQVLRNSTESHIITNHYILPLLIRDEGGILFEVSDGTLEYNLQRYRCNCLFYDLAKISINRMAWALSHELSPYKCTAIGITSGWLRSEMMLDGFNVAEENWRDALEIDPGFSRSETPRFIGRAISYLSADPDVYRFNGHSLTSFEVAKIYGFTDIDGSQPDGWRQAE
ncbi:MAG: SDR family oxidoreductase [Anaerolineaceae bacterium]|nr:SDR family oxidoreductase [Anaerolineaceae bacterium]